MKKRELLFITILIEGYVVLACELLAIRQLMPFVGSGTEIVAIIISGVLLPLAIGYEAGGKAFKKERAKARLHKRKPLSLRKILRGNILIALAILSFGLSFPVLELFFGALNLLGITHRLPQTAIYVLVFIITPVYMLAQTVPLVSNYFSRQHLSEITGKMLFFSTVGSFFGSVFSTIVLMTTIGVHNTVIITLGLMCLLCLLLMGKKFSYEALLYILFFAGICFMNGEKSMNLFHMVSDNAYNTVSIVDAPQDKAKVMIINRSPSSMIGKEDPALRAPYISFIENTFINPLANSSDKPLDILVIGSGGFTVGLQDDVSNYTFVDIDPTIKDVAETYFLNRKLGPNKKFVAASARAFVHTCDKKYDLILLDTYTNGLAIPMETTTREYLLEVKKLLKEDGILVANIISSPNFGDAFTVRYDNTFSSVFPKHSRQLVTPFYFRQKMPRNKRDWEDANILYIYYNNKFMSDDSIYTDDKNSYSLDVRDRK